MAMRAKGSQCYQWFILRTGDVALSLVYRGRMRTILVLAIASVAACLVSGNLVAQPLRVIDTAPNDVLNVREYPTTDARIVGVIPPDTTTVQFLGDRRGRWVFVRYRNVEGWVSSRFVVPIEPPVRRGRDPSRRTG